MKDWEMRRLADAIEDLHRDLVKLQKYLQAVVENHESHQRDKTPETKPPEVRAVLEYPVTITKYKDPNKKQPWVSRHKKGLKTILEVAAVVVAGVLAVLNWGVLNEIQKQTPKIAESAGAAQKAATVADNTLRLDQRSWVGISFPVPPVTINNGFLAIPIVVSNSGKTPARLIQIRATGTVTNAQHPQLDLSQNGPAHGSLLRIESIIPGQDVKGLVIPVATIRQTPRLSIAPFIPSPEFMATFRNGMGSDVVVAYGKITYGDYFSKSHWVTFCHYVNGVIGGSDECFVYNDFDHDPPGMGNQQNNK